jgi:hypothetical protein
VPSFLKSSPNDVSVRPFRLLLLELCVFCAKIFLKTLQSHISPGFAEIQNKPSFFESFGSGLSGLGYIQNIIEMPILR